MDNSPSTKGPTEMDTSQTSQQILDIITEFALNKFDDSKDRFAAGTQTFLSVIGRFVASQAEVEACLPAFPFKSANQVYKVLGTLPDKAEELALQRLDSMCKRIKEIYPPGAKVTIISDGITYNDLLSISDRDTWAYGEALRKMATEKKFDNIAFSRIKDLLDLPLPETLREITYVANCTNFRRLLLNKHGRPDLDIDAEIASNPDTKLTYLGYRRFLESDLRHIFPPSEERTKNGYKRDVKFLAKQMLIRGYAFAGAVKEAYPNHLRLSIHESIGEHKVSISLLNTKTGFTTPWHCSVALLADGDWISAPMSEFIKDPRLELVYEQDRPSYFKEISDGSSGSGVAGDESWASYLQTRKTPTIYSSGSSFSSVSSPEGRNTPPSATGLGITACSTPNSSFSNGADTAGLAITAYSTPDSSLSTAAFDTAVITETHLDQDKGSASPYGRRLIPQIMDQMAIAEPNRIVFTLSRYAKNTLHFQDISAGEFARAVDKTAWWLQGHVGSSSSSIRPVGYIGPHDLRHILLTYACAKAGCVALFLSPKNSVDGSLSVLEAVDCNTWVKAQEAANSPMVSQMLEKRAVKVLEMPSLEELLDAASVDPYPYTKTFEEAANDPFCYLHTSGTTGPPKPIPWSHGLIGTMDAVRLLPPVEGDNGLLPWTSDWKDGDSIYSSFPMSHGAGIIMDILMPALFGLRCVLGPANIIPNIGLIESLAELAAIDIWSMVPSLVDELGETPDVLQRLQSSKFICASGGPVSPVSAGKVNDVIRVLNLTGTTEGLFIGNLVVPREDWFWFAFHPYSGFEFKEVDPDTYEHWVHRNEHSSLFQGIFHTFPEKDSVNFKDLYKKHPTKPNFWAFKGRSDDLVVLSNGYKISPLETEAFISTHPAINGCLIIGTGKPQAALLVELKDPSEKSEELLDSIWSTVQQANLQSRHTNQLLRDFVTFTDPKEPFVRTDKGTVKRPATLSLYSDYIDRFYTSRSDDVPSYAVDTSSVESIQHDVSEIISSYLPDIEQIPFHDNLFELGMDSLAVFAAVKTVRAATGLRDELAPRHLYANPSIAEFSTVIYQLSTEVKPLPSDSDLDKSASASLKAMIAQHRARQSFKLNASDYVNPNHYMGLVFYLPLAENVSFKDAFANLQQGLNRTFDMIPALGGKMMYCSEQEIGYKKGDLCVTIPPLSLAKTVHNRVIYKDFSNELPDFEQLRSKGFMPSAFKDGLVLPDDPFPKFPADIVVAQANFVTGGCILAVNMNHCCLDGIGVMIALKVWAENCRYLQGETSATCDWYDPESFNHSLPEIIHEQEGWLKDLESIDPGTWGFLPFQPVAAVDAQANASSDIKRLPPAPEYTLHSIWPLPRADRVPNTTVFSISAANMKKMRKQVLADPHSNGTAVSVSDMVQAFFWRSAIRARYQVAKELKNRNFGSDEMSILELPTDGRPYFSSQLPSTYMGSMLIMSRSTMSIETLCAPETSITTIAQVLRATAGLISPSLVHDAFTILQSLPDYSRFSTANMGLDHMHAMISNLMLFQTREISFGDELFGNSGSPEYLRPQLERGNGRFRFLIISPLKKDGSVELVMGTFPEELDMLRRDKEFTSYAEFVDCSDT